jgi:Leucine-rich repeat (LRR) protein
VKSIKGLENIATLTQLDLPGTKATTVAALAASRALQVMTVPKVLTSLRGIEMIATLREISLFDCESISSLATLARCTALTKICVEGTPLTDPGALAGFQALIHLQQLTLMFTEIADLSSIAGCISLNELTVSGSPQLKSISCLAHHPSLARLSVRLCGLTSQSSIEGLQHIHALRELNLSDNAALNSVAIISGHRGLEELNISCTAVNDAGTAGLERIPTLRRFVAHGTKITSVRHLAASPSLTDISLHGSPVTDAGVVGLECLRTLVSLDLSDTKVTNVDHLRNSTSLETLRLAFTGRRKKTPPLEFVRHLMTSSDDDDD